MKRLLIILCFITLTAMTYFGCERDDICAESTATTPRLLIEFYDASNPENLKNVPRITVYGEDLVRDVDGNVIEPIVASEATLLFNENEKIVELPLKIGVEGETTTTRFILEKDTNLRLDEDNLTNSNIDILEITYTSEFVYVSRACGYKSVFNLENIIVDPADTNNWISNITIDNTTIENEDTVHVRIFH